MSKQRNNPKIKLDDYEQEVLKGLEKQRYKSALNLKREMEQYSAAARETLTKDGI